MCIIPKQFMRCSTTTMLNRSFIRNKCIDIQELYFKEYYFFFNKSTLLPFELKVSIYFDLKNLKTQRADFTNLLK